MTARLRGALRLGAGLAAIALLAGCSSTSNGTGTYKRYFQAVRESSAGLFTNQSITRQQAASTPYASLGYRVNNGPQIMLVLATDAGGDDIWTASNHVVFQTRDGRLARTVGLPHNLAALAPQHGDGLPPPSLALKQPFTSKWTEDLPDLGAYSVTMSCSAAAAGPETTTVLGQAIRTVRINEACESQQLGWRFTNSYWLDPNTGMAWRSIQHLTPEGETVEITILRPPG